MHVLLVSLLIALVYAVIAAAVTGIRGATTVARVNAYGAIDDKPLVVTGIFWPVSIAIWLWNRLAKFFYWLTIWGKEASYLVTGDDLTEPFIPDVQYADTGWEPTPVEPTFHKEDYEPVIHPTTDV